MNEWSVIQFRMRWIWWNSEYIWKIRRVISQRENYLIRVPISWYFPQDWHCARFFPSMTPWLNFEKNLISYFMLYIINLFHPPRNRIPRRWSEIEFSVRPILPCRLFMGLRCKATYQLKTYFPVIFSSGSQGLINTINYSFFLYEPILFWNSTQSTWQLFPRNTYSNLNGI